MSLDKYQKYFNEYVSQHSLEDHYLELGQTIIKTSYYQLIYYKGYKSNFKRTFLVIPSVFNSPAILFLSSSKNFIENLRQYGEIFLRDWLEINEVNYFLEDYVKRIEEIIRELKSHNTQEIDLIGHCIGENLAIAASIILPDYIKTLTLISTPCDFSHFSLPYSKYNYLGLESHIQNLTIVPK